MQGDKKQVVTLQNILQDISYYKILETPVGKLQIIASGNGLRYVLSKNHFYKKSEGLVEKSDHPVLLKTEKQISEYFAGKRKEFDIKLDMRGTVFQIKAWRELQKIPYGKTISYGEQAARIGDAKKARAVGAANGRNPLLIIVPCHRVIGSSGALTGFASGLDMKQKLLELEKS